MPVVAKRTVFSYVATYNDLERRFAEFLDKKAGDVLRSASLSTTEQAGSGTQLRVDYLKPHGTIGFYHPDGLVVVKAAEGEVNWIVETKGCVWEGTTAKHGAVAVRRDRVTQAVGQTCRYQRVDQPHFDATRASTLGQLLQPARLMYSGCPAFREV